MKNLAAISAQLSKLAEEPPELGPYLQSHVKVVDRLLRPKGLVYELRSGQSYRRIFAHKLEELNLKDNPAQEAAFRNTVKQTASDLRPRLLQPMSGPIKGRESLVNDSSVDDDDIVPFNETPFQHFFLPIVQGSEAAGVLHAWFDPANTEAVQKRQALLKQFADEFANYLKNRRAVDLSQEVSRLNTYAHLLEDLAGDIDLDSVAWSLVNFARETVECERVSIFSVKRYPAEEKDGEPEWEILACSGLKRPHPRSEQAEVLKAVVKELSKLALNGASKPAEELSKDTERNEDSEAKALPAVEPSEQASSREDTATAEKTSEKEDDKPAPALPAGERPQFKMIFTYRDPGKAEGRPESINAYFEQVPMNWATTIPLFDRDGRVCGILLFEGQESAEKAKRSFMPMRDLAYSGGRAVGTALYWNKRTALKAARSFESARLKATKTSKRRFGLKVLLPIAIIVGILLMPTSFKINGTAILRPTVVESVPAELPLRLKQVYVHEGELVEAGQLLAELDASDQLLQLKRYESERTRYLAEADRARSEGRETAMQSALLNARQAELETERLRRDISKARITAPFDGAMIGPTNIRQRKGDVFQYGEIVAELAQLGEWEVKIDVREQDLVFLSEELAEGSVPIIVKFASDPTREHELILSDPRQLAYGLRTAEGDYSFTVVVPIVTDPDIVSNFRVGYSGNAKFELGERPLAYVFFRDFVHFIRLNWM